MSVKSSSRSRSQSSTPSSILKRPKTLTSRVSEIQNKPSKVTFVLPHTQKVKSIFSNYIQNGESREYEQLVIMIRDAKLTDNDLSSLLKEATECISVLDQNLRLFVEALLAVQWIDKGPEVVSEYQSFIVNLLSAHNYHAKMVIDRLVKLFLPSKYFLFYTDSLHCFEIIGPLLMYKSF